MYLNQTVLIGDLIEDPEMTATGTVPACELVIMTKEVFPGKNNERREVHEHHRVVAFGKKAELVKRYLRKGEKVNIVGKLKTRSYLLDGSKVLLTEIVAESIQFNPPRKVGQEIRPFL
jgi:single-strand DNA-binding protein